MSDKPKRTRRQFTPEFKRDAVELVRTTDRPIAEIARELGIYDSTLGNWVRQDRIDRGEQDGLTHPAGAADRGLDQPAQGGRRYDTVIPKELCLRKVDPRRHDGWRQSS